MVISKFEIYRILAKLKDYYLHGHPNENIPLNP